MTVTRPNALIAAGIALANAIVPFLILVNALHWDASQVAAFAGVISLLGTFVGLLFASTPITNTPVPAPTPTPTFAGHDTSTTSALTVLGDGTVPPSGP